MKKKQLNNRLKHAIVIVGSKGRLKIAGRKIFEQEQLKKEMELVHPFFESLIRTIRKSPVIRS